MSEKKFYKVFYAMKPDYEYKKNQYSTVIASNRIEALRKAFDLVPEADVWGMVVESSVYGTATDMTIIDCPDCDGEGEYIIDAHYVWAECAMCEGLGVVENDQLTQSPEIAQSNVIERVQVSHWRTGERAGKQSSGTFEVVNRFELNGTPFVAYQFTDKLVHTVKEEYTKAVA